MQREHLGMAREATGSWGSSLLRTAAPALLVSVGYYVGANIGFILRFPPATPSVMWPPNAILTATLLLIPTGMQTLATQFWQYETDNSYAQAAPFALVMIALAAVPSYVLGRFFDRSTSTRG